MKKVCIEVKRCQKHIINHVGNWISVMNLAECQVGYFYFEGLGVKTDLEQALYWTSRAAEHGDRDGQYNLAWFYEEAIGVSKDMEKAKYWYRQAALQGHDMALKRILEKADNEVVRLETNQNHVTVYLNDTIIGSIELYTNSWHKQNQYLKFKDFIFEAQISAEVFRKLFDMVQRPLQIMTNSENLALIEFITAGGFVCKRKCYEIEARLGDYIGKVRTPYLLRTHKGEAEYDLCCRLIYERYVETHRAINPLTADCATFVSDLPNCVFYQEEDGFISSFAFVEENEIAYVYGGEDGSFISFAEMLVCQLMNEYQTICFEADDCDGTAMQLKALFKGQGELSFDTYIKADY